MKKRNLWLTVLSLIISICACFCFAACGSCSSCDDGNDAPAELTVPVVTIDYDGVASWGAIENASGYIYRVDGKDTATERTAVQIADGQSIRVKAVGDGAKYTDSDWSKAVTFIQTYALATPAVTIAEDGTASWAAVAHATKYTVKIGDNETDTTELSKKLSNGQSIAVKAVGEGLYRDSEYSAVKAYNKLSAPQISVSNDGLASWGEVANATGYIYKINDETTERIAEGLNFQLSNGHKISVKATGAEGWFDSDWATATYIDKTKLIKLATPEVTVEEVTGIAIWNAVPNASGYAYKINGGEEQTVASSVISCGLKANETITVKALGDDEIYTDSEWSQLVKYEVAGNTPITLDAPVVTVDADGVARWSAIDGADRYEIEIDGKSDGITTDLYKKLSDGQIIRVKAVDGNGNESDFSKPVKYEAPVPDEVTVNGVKFDFDFIDFVDSDPYSLKDANDDFKTACGNSNGFGEVIALGNIFKGSGSETGLLKFSSSSTDGYITLNFKKEVVRVVISCKKYNNGSVKLKVNEGTAQAVSSTLQDLVFDLATPAMKIKIEAENRSLVYSITAYFRLPTTLDKPEINIDENGVATWERDENASGYTYTVNGVAHVANELRVQLSSGDKIVVTAVGDGIDYLSSVSDEKLYTEVKIDSLAERYALAVAFLQGMEELKLGAEHKEDFTLPLSLYGVNIMWTSDETEVLDVDFDSGKVTVNQPENASCDVVISAALYYGDFDDENFYKPEDASELTFLVTVPAIVKQKLDAPKISINPNTGVATWTAVENTIGYSVTYYGFVDDNYNSEYYNEELMFDPDDERAVQLQNKLWITVQALGDDKYYTDSDIASKQFNYYPETTTPDGTPLIFDFKDIPQNDSNELAQPTSFFNAACGNASEFKGVTTSKVYLGNSSSESASHIGGGFLKVGTSSVNGKITLTFGKKVYGVVIECQTWSEDTHDKVSVNGSEEQIAKKNGWGTLTFNFGTAHASETVEILTNKRVFIKSITVYLAE